MSYYRSMHHWVLALSVATVRGAPPATWQRRIDALDMLYSTNEPDTSKMPVIGNGLLATRMTDTTLFVSGLWNGYSTVTPSHLVQLQSTVSFAAPGVISDAALDLRGATYYRRSFVDPNASLVCDAQTRVTCTNSASRIWVEQRWYAHRELASVLVHEVEVLTADNATRPAPAPYDDAALSAASPFAVVMMNLKPGDPVTDVSFLPISLPSDAPYSIINGSTLLAEWDTAGLQAIAILTTNLPSGNALLVEAPGVTYTFLTVIATTVETPAEALVQRTQADWAVAVARATRGTLHSTHTAAWESAIWTSSIEIKGRPDVAVAVNASLYAILSAMRDGRPEGVGPYGLDWLYKSHVFWDQDLFMGVGLLLQWPGLIENMLEYRFNRLSGARMKARSYHPPVGGYNGTMIPWESAHVGVETADWMPTGLREIHISGDVAYLAWQYFRLTGNTTWLQTRGFPILSGVADFWVSRALADTPGAIVRGWNNGWKGGDAGRKVAAAVEAECRAAALQISAPFGSAACDEAMLAAAAAAPLHIKNVSAPDEYADEVDDDAFTNAAAIVSLLSAVSAARALGVPAEEYAPWEDAAERISLQFNATPGVPGFEEGYHPEYAGYTNGTTKQADVVLLGFPLDFGTQNSSAGRNMMPGVRRNDLLWYAAVTDPNGPAMTWGAHCIGFLDIGDPASAAPLFNRSFANVQPPFAVWWESPTSGFSNFLTGAGGFLWTVVYGFPGARLNDTALALRPVLPEGATEMVLRGLAFRGNRLALNYNNATMFVALMSASGAPDDDGAYGVVARDRAGGTGAAAAAAPSALVLIDEAGARHSLSTKAVSLPRQRVAIVVA